MARRRVAQCFQQRRDAVVGLRSTRENRHDPILLQPLLQFLIECFRRRLLVVQKLLQEIVIEIREAFHELPPGNGPSLSSALRHFNERRGPIGLIAPCPLAYQINEANHFLPFPNGHLAQQQRAPRDSLKSLQQLADPFACPIHLVDKDEMRDPAIIQELQQGRQADRALGLSVSYHYGYRSEEHTSE